MANYSIKKPRMFISHATSDAELANTLREEVVRVFAEGVDVFCTSSPRTIKAGTDWLNMIENNLDTSQAVIVILSPSSIKRSWLWFEIGATWLKGRRDECRIYSLCTPQVTKEKIPEPLNRLQALSIDSDIELKQLFDDLTSQFGFGKASIHRQKRIKNSVNKYDEIEYSDNHEFGGTIVEYVWKFLYDYRSVYVDTPEECKDIRFEIFARFLLAILMEERPKTGFTNAYVYMRIYKVLLNVTGFDIYEHDIKYSGKEFLLHMNVLESLSLIKYDASVWYITSLGTTMIDNKPHFLSYDDDEIMEILHFSKEYDNPTIEQSKTVIATAYQDTVL